MPKVAPVAANHASGRRPRIDELDMTKGVLVIFMVIYHTFNYSTDFRLGFLYLPFLPPSFILITGFLIGRLYLRGESASSPGAPARLLFRGLRLLVIFTLLNLLVQAVGRNKPSGLGQLDGSFFDYSFEIYVLGGASAAFGVLLPIAYLLMLAPVLLLSSRLNRFLPAVLALGVVVTGFVVERWEEPCANLILLSAGFLGVLCGIFANGILRLGHYWIIPVAAYIGYLFLQQSIGQTIGMQLLRAWLAVIAIFATCAALGTRGFLRQRTVTLGRYSLLSYIFQIALLQLLARVLDRFAPGSVPFILEMIFVLMAMACVVELTNWLRERSRPFAFVHNAVLG